MNKEKRKKIEGERIKKGEKWQYKREQIKTSTKKKETKPTFLPC
jgi:hypothetical protein